MGREPAKIAPFVAAFVLVDAMRPSLYAPSSLPAGTALALNACQRGDMQPAARAQEATATRQADGALMQHYHDWFGERWWMRPNPSDGGWELVQFDNDNPQLRQQRHDAKRAALEVAR